MKRILLKLLLSTAALAALPALHAAPVTPLSERDRQSFFNDIDPVTRRDGSEVRPVDRFDGVEELDLRGTFQQVTLIRRDEQTNELVQACVNSVEQAGEFFGVDLRSGVPMPKQWFSVEGKAALSPREEIAARHGMSVAEFEAISA